MASTAQPAPAPEAAGAPKQATASSPLLSFPTISAAAFLLGASTACIVSLRRGRRAAAAEHALARSSRTAAAAHAHSPAAAEASSSSSSSSSDEGFLAVAQRGPLALFSELNAAAFRRPAPTDSTSVGNAVPSVLSAKARGKQPVRAELDTPPRPQRPGGRDMWSAFDDAPVGAPPPAVLMRRRAPAAKDDNVAAAAPGGIQRAQGTSTVPLAPASLQHTTHGRWDELARDRGPAEETVWDEDDPHPPPPPADESVWTSPVAMAVGALTIATALVGCTAFVAVQVAKSLIGFDTTDEFVQRMAELVPPQSRISAMLGLPSPPASLVPAAADADADLNATWDELGVPPSPPSDAAVLEEQREPQDQSPLEAALARLEGARSPAEWWGMVREQLDAERAEDVAAREARVSAARRGGEA